MRRRVNSAPSPDNRTAGRRRGGFRALLQEMAAEVHEHRSTALVYVTLRVLVIVTMVLQFLNGNYENVFLCLLTLVLFLVPAFVQVTFKVELPSTLEIIVLLFIFSAEILGEISSFYVLFPFWDVTLHTLNGFLAAAIGFSLVDLLNRSDRVKFDLSPLFLAIVAFCFSMTIGVLWEFFEFAMDQLFALDMQKDTIVHAIHSVTLDPTNTNTTVTIDGITDTMVNGVDLGVGGYLDIGLIDTMEDLIVNFIGAAVFSVIGFLYVRSRGKNTVLSRFIPYRKHGRTIEDWNNPANEPAGDDTDADELAEQVDAAEHAVEPDTRP